MSTLTQTINRKNVRVHFFPRKLIALEGSRRLSVMRDEGTAALQQTSVARVAPQQAGYFENTVAGKITEMWFAFFWATFIMYRGRPKCI